MGIHDLPVHMRGPVSVGGRSFPASIGCRRVPCLRAAFVACWLMLPKACYTSAIILTVHMQVRWSWQQ